METPVRSSSRRVIESDSQTDTTSAQRLCVRIPYQADTLLFGGWGVRF